MTDQKLLEFNKALYALLNTTEDMLAGKYAGTDGTELTSVFGGQIKTLLALYQHERHAGILNLKEWLGGQKQSFDDVDPYDDEAKFFALGYNQCRNDVLHEIDWLVERDESD